MFVPEWIRPVSAHGVLSGLTGHTVYPRVSVVIEQKQWNVFYPESFHFFLWTFISSAYQHSSHPPPPQKKAWGSYITEDFLLA